MLSHSSSQYKKNAAFKNTDDFNKRTINILEMIAIGRPASEIYDAIAALYESRHEGLYCSMLELQDGKLLHGGAPSLPRKYCEAVHGLANGPDVGSCGTSTYTGKRCIVEDITTDPKWTKLKQYALPHGLRCCWSEPIKDSHGKVLGAFGMYYKHPAAPNENESNDLISAARLAGLVMERDHNQKRIRELAFVDSLTKLASRANFFQYIENLISTATHYQRSFSLLYLDLDDFKTINDSKGHDVGDRLLQQIAIRLRSRCPDIDFIGRLGGDEFCIVTEKGGDKAISAQIAKCCMDAISEPIYLDDSQQTVTCSIGIAHFPHDNTTISGLLKAADTALHSAKNKGKNRFELYHVQLTEQVEYKFSFEQKLRYAVNNRELHLLYQPQVDLQFNKIIGVEALARWHHPKLGSVSPAEFISAAERIGVIEPLTEWALDTACKQLIEWENVGISSVTMSVNVSPSLFSKKKLVSIVKKVIERTKIDPHKLELEITESAAQLNPNNLSVFKELKALGVRLAIDDFGTGYSSFASLKHISVDTLKIDKFFIDDIIHDESAKFLIGSMIAIGHSLSHKIVAEGVENNSQLKVLKELDCDIVQGFLFSKPVSASDIKKALKRENNKS